MPAADVAAFLRTLTEFGRTSARALEELAELCEVWSFREGDLVRFPDAEPDSRIWVGEGCLAAARPEQPPDYIGVREEAAIPRGYWLRGQTAGWYVRLPLASWHRWNRTDGAAPALIFRQSAVLPAVRAAVPAAFGALFAGLGLVLSSLGTDVPWWILWLLPGSGILAALAWIGLIVLEWRRSFVSVSGRRLEIRVLDLGAKEAVFESLDLGRVRSAVLIRTGFWGLLGLAGLELETDVPGGGPGARFRFPGLPVSSRVTEMLGPPPEEPAAAPQAWAAKAGRAPSLERPARPEPDAWFRRHWWFLAGRCLPWLGWCALAAFVAAWAAGLWPAGASWCAVLGAAAATVPLGRAAWEAWDWANDRFGVTAGQVVLLRRRPLWFGEIRHEAPLDQVEQLGVLRTGLAALVLDFGTVTVRLGPAEPLVFEGLARPDAVRQAVLSRRKAVFAQRERHAAGQRFEEVADIIQAWNEGQRNGYWDGVKP